jgi:DNA polymerase eta
MANNPPARVPSLWKGKARATENDFDDLNPTITYRILHSQNLGVRNPLRVIALCDSDAFYASCEEVRLGISKDKPVAVLQWDMLIAVNYTARTYGISRIGEPRTLFDRILSLISVSDKLVDAKKKCPDLIAVHVATYKECVLLHFKIHDQCVLRFAEERQSLGTGMILIPKPTRCVEVNTFKISSNFNLR